MDRNSFLFSNTDAHSVQEGQRQALETEIANLEDNRLLNTNLYCENRNTPRTLTFITLSHASIG